MRTVKKTAVAVENPARRPVSVAIGRGLGLPGWATKERNCDTLQEMRRRRGRPRSSRPRPVVRDQARGVAEGDDVRPGNYICQSATDANYTVLQQIFEGGTHAGFCRPCVGVRASVYAPVDASPDAPGAVTVAARRMTATLRSSSDISARKLRQPAN